VQITPGRFLREKALAPDGLTQEELAEAMMCCADCERQRPTNDHRRRWALRLETLTRVSAEMRLTCNGRSIFRGRSPRLCWSLNKNVRFMFLKLARCESI